MTKPNSAWIWLALVCVPAGCTRSHEVGPAPTDAAWADAGHSPVDAGPPDASDYIPGDPGTPAYREQWVGYCERMLPLVSHETRASAEDSCATFMASPGCHPLLRQLNHCLDVARSMYDGTPLDVTMIPACHDLCPHADGG